MSTQTYKYQWRRNGTAIAGATAASYIVRTADVGHKMTCAVTAVNAAGPSSPTTTLATAVVPPFRPFAAPLGPTAPARGYRLVLADDFNGSTLDTSLWTPTPQYPGAPAVSGPYNSWEKANLLSANVSLDGNSNLKMINNTQTTTANDGITRNYGGCAVGTAGGAMSSTAGFRYSPAFAGPLYLEVRAKTTGSATNGGACAYPGFWATSVRTWGRTPAQGDNANWTVEHDFFEWASGHAPPWPDSNVIVPSNGYGGNGAMGGNGSPFGSGQPNAPIPGIADCSQAMHTYTARINTDGSFDTWVDGNFWRTCPANNVGSFGAPTVDRNGNPHNYPSFSLAYDWMAIQIQADMDQPPGAGWPGDEMLIDYIAVWQDAAVPPAKASSAAASAPAP